MSGGKPYTPESLAERWGISERQVRRMLASGKLKGFKPGEKLWRISVEEVARVEAGEQCLTSSSEYTEGSSAPSSGTMQEIADAIRSEQMIENLRRVS